MAYKIDKHLTLVNKGTKGNNHPEWIVFHFVGARGQAWDNAVYFYNVYRAASAHYFADPNNIVQVVEDDTPAWHVGDGKPSGKGQYNGYHGHGATNFNSIGIEACQDTSIRIDGINDVWHWDFNPETINKVVWLIKELQKKYNIDNNHVIRHFDVSGKICPGNWQYENWKRWELFKKRLETDIKQVKPSTSTKEEAQRDSSRMYKVQIGDTLSGIAKKHNVTVNQLIEWNDINNPDLIFPETKLNVKAETKVVVQPPKTTQTPQKTVSNASTLHLPKTAHSWLIYKPDGPYTTSYAIGALSPSKFGGLTYNIVGNPMADVHLIDTRDFGRVAIYTAKGTGAVINKATSNSTPTPAPKTPAGLVKYEKATFTVTHASGIIVRSSPIITKDRSNVTGTLKKGQSIKYDSVYEINGYRWLSYIAASGNRRYVPYREAPRKGVNWGTFS